MQTFGSEIRVNGARVIRQPVDKEGLVATLFRPIASGPRPTVIVLQGSLGGMLEASAAVLASQGFPALALAYAEVSAGRAFVVPRGIWHRVLVRESGKLMFCTPGPRTEHRSARRVTERNSPTRRSRLPGAGRR